MKRMIDTNVIKALSVLFANLSDFSDEELGRFVRSTVKRLQCRDRDDAQEQERLKACTRVAAFIRDNFKATHLDVWQCMQNEGLSTEQDVRDIGRRTDESLRSVHLHNSLMRFIKLKALLENGQARFIECRSIGKEPVVGWRLRSDDGDECKSLGVMAGHEQGSLFMVTQCSSLLPECISVKLRSVMCENYDSIMKDVYAMCERLRKADTFNEIPITKDEFNKLRNLVL